jgi:Ca-activated chloride channel family protein
VTAINAAVAIEEQVSATSIELTLTNKGGTNQEAVLLLPVPDGVAVRSLQYDGTGPEPTAQVLPRDEARRIYESIVNRVRDPALVEFVGFNLIKTSAFPIPAGRSQKLSLTYEQVLGWTATGSTPPCPAARPSPPPTRPDYHRRHQEQASHLDCHSPSHEIDNCASAPTTRVKLSGARRRGRVGPSSYRSRRPPNAA